LSHYLNYLNRITSYYGGVFSDSSSSDLDTDISNIEFDIFDEDMKNKLNKIGIIDIDDLNDLKTYLNDDEKYNEINEYYGGEYADCYNSAFNNSAKSIADKVKNLIKFESGENRLKISKSDFIGYIKSYLIYQQTDVIDFDDLIEYMFDDNDLPKYDYEFNEYANDSVELDFSNVLKITKEKVYNAIEERKKEIEKEIGISDEIIAELFDRFKIVLPKLKFKIVSDNVYEFDNGTYNIKITLDKKYVNDDGTMIAMYVTYLKNKTLDGYTSPEGLENEFIKNNLINEKIKIKRKQNI
jgi:hypothetical protein